ncbi:MAG: histone deacetylase [Actinomycetota bacterium]|nr:histone deacetylase [Actinomycetota bacterium]
MVDPSPKIWYVSYGSNLSWARFRCYLSGGTPPGAQRANRGARDPSPPQADVAVTLPGQVYFACDSTMWAGGVAFYDSAVPATTLARGYLLTNEQFADVMAQELGGLSGTLPAVPTLEAGDRLEMTAGRYGTLVGCGQRQGVPMATFSAPWCMADVDLHAPSLAYLVTLATGLSESHGLDLFGQAAYLAGLPGTAARWDAASLVDALS